VASYSGTALTPLVGRDRELRAIELRLANGARLVTLLGPGGSGKTRLAREVFDRRRLPGTEAYFVDLVGIADPALVPAEIAAELRVTETPDLDAAGAVVAALRETSAVLVLDNLEELTGARDFVAGLLRAAPVLQVITTSRIPLGIPGEVEFPVPPLELPQGDGPAEVEASPAGALFLERARAVGRLDEVDDATARAVAELCRRLDGLPLALELAAARTRILPPAAILRHLTEHTSGLLAKTGGDDIRHESLDAVVAWSLDLLDSNEAEALTAVSICPGGFDLAIAEALAPGLNVLHAIDVLTTHGLLSQRDEVEGEPWYRLLETVRIATLERASEEASLTRWARLAAHVTQRVAGTHEAFFMIDEGAFRRLDLLLDTVRAVLDWTEVNDPALNLSIAAAFGRYWQVRGRAREGISRLRAAIAANPTPSPDLASAFLGLVQFEQFNKGVAEARRAAEEAVRIARVARDPEREVAGLSFLLLFAPDSVTPAPGGSGEFDPTITSRVRELLPTLVHPVSVHNGLTALAFAEEQEAGFTPTVVRHFRDADEVLNGTPYRLTLGGHQGNLAWRYLYRDHPVDAYEHATRALTALSEAGPVIVAWAHALRAIAAAGTGQITEAWKSLRSAIEPVTAGGTVLSDEIMVAVIAVLAVSDAPLLAAKAWGAMTGSAFSVFLEDEHRLLGERLLVPARRGTDPVSFDVAIRAGEQAGASRVIEEVVAHLDSVTRTAPRIGPRRLAHGTLTRREVEVLALVGAGKSDRAIAAELFISPKTVSVHVSNAKAKLGVDTRLEAALWVRERGLVSDKAQGS
jgi:predicted ATPase/DNA-binding CsgD family transcriptional regulator